MEVVTLIPDAAYLASDKKKKPFSGRVIVENWSSSFIKAYLFSDGKTYQASSVSYSQDEKQVQSPGSAIAVNSWTRHCTYTHNWTQVEIDGAAYEPNYNGSEEHCWYEYSGDSDLLKLYDGGGTDGDINGGGGYNPAQTVIDAIEVEAIRGDKPIDEYDDKCIGVQEIWDNYSNNEVTGYITSDGKLIVIDVVSLIGGTTSGTYYHDGIAYYPYPASQGPPANNYKGMIQQAGYYFIPVIASVHTHTPCRTDGTNGVSHAVGEDDLTRAKAAPYISHWVIGCGAIAQYDGNNSYFYNIKSGSLSASCSYIRSIKYFLILLSALTLAQRAVN